MGAIVCIPCDDNILDHETLQNTRLNHVTSKDSLSSFHEIDCDKDCIISLLAPEPSYKKRKSSVEFHTCEDEIVLFDKSSSHSTRMDRIRSLRTPPCSPKSGDQSVQAAHSAQSAQSDPKSNVSNRCLVPKISITLCKDAHDAPGEHCNGNSEIETPIPIMKRQLKLQPLPARIVVNVLGLPDETYAVQHRDFSG